MAQTLYLLINGRLCTSVLIYRWAGPVTGPVMAMVFGWLPAFLWVVIGGVFFGAVQDFSALYASD